jgi:hypothetical protein
MMCIFCAQVVKVKNDSSAIALKFDLVIANKYKKSVKGSVIQPSEKI